jgi:hypothetical protein
MSLQNRNVGFPERSAYGMNFSDDDPDWGELTPISERFANGDGKRDFR